MLQEPSETFPNTESANDKMLEADPDLERRMTIALGIEKMLTPFHELYCRKKANYFR